MSYKLKKLRIRDYIGGEAYGDTGICRDVQVKGCRPHSVYGLRVQEFGGFGVWGIDADELGFGLNYSYRWPGVKLGKADARNTSGYIVLSIVMFLVLLL